MILYSNGKTIIAAVTGFIKTPVEEPAGGYC
jgi:hypothetical protein